MLIKLNYSVNIFFSLFFFKLILFNTNWYNLTYKIHFDFNFFHMYGFFWTNYWYIYLFIVFLFFLQWLFYFNYYFNSTLVIMLLLKYFYMLDIYLLTLVNLQLDRADLHYFDLNTLLINLLTNVHPFIFYFSVNTYFLIFLIFINQYYSDFLFFSETRINTLFIYMKKFFIVMMLSLLLGSWWALQEGSWGGWWNWDASETLGLFPLVASVVFFHYRFCITHWVNLFFFFFMILIYCIWTYTLVQLNFNDTSHNFGIRFFFFFNSNAFLLEFFFILYGMFFLCNSIFKYFVKISFLNIFNILFSISVFKKYFWIGIFTFFIIEIFVISFNPFFYFLFSVKNAEIYLMFNSVTFFFFLLLNFALISKFLWFGFYFVKHSYFFFLMFCFRSPILKINAILHFYGLNFFFLTILTSNCLFLQYQINGYFFKYINEFVTYYTQLSTGFNAYAFENLFSLLNKNQWITGWGLNNLFDVFNYFFFWFYFTNINFFSTLMTNSNNFFYTLIIAEPLTGYFFFYIIFLVYVIFFSFSFKGKFFK